MKNKYLLFIILIILSIYFILITNVFERNILFNTKINKNKYIIYRCDSDGECGGWGDRLKGIFSAYWWAILTDRQLIIQITKPCPLTEIFEPNEIKWNMQITKEINYTEVLLSNINEQNFKRSLITTNLSAFYSEFTTIILKTNRNYAASFAKNKFLTEKLKLLGYLDQSKIDLQFSINSIYKKLFKFKPKLNEIYLNFIKKSKPNKSSVLICTHIRTGDIDHKGNHVNKHTPFKNFDDKKWFWNFIKKNLISNVLPHETYKIFIISNNKDVLKDGYREFNQTDLLIYENGNETTLHIDLMGALENKCSSSTEKTFLDFIIFQNCDMILLTKGTQFGLFAAMNRKSPPRLLYIEDLKTNNLDLYSPT